MHSRNIRTRVDPTINDSGGRKNTDVRVSGRAHCDRFATELIDRNAEKHTVVPETRLFLIRFQGVPSDVVFLKAKTIFLFIFFLGARTNRLIQQNYSARYETSFGSNVVVVVIKQCNTERRPPFDCANYFARDRQLRLCELSTKKKTTEFIDYYLLYYRHDIL
jgi:hypothetical protein